MLRDKSQQELVERLKANPDKLLSILTWLLAPSCENPAYQAFLEFQREKEENHVNFIGLYALRDLIDNDTKLLPKGKKVSDSKSKYRRFGYCQ